MIVVVSSCSRGDDPEWKRLACARIGGGRGQKKEAPRRAAEGCYDCESGRLLTFGPRRSPGPQAQDSRALARRRPSRSLRCNLARSRPQAQGVLRRSGPRTEATVRPERTTTHHLPPPVPVSRVWRRREGRGVPAEVATNRRDGSHAAFLSPRQQSSPPFLKPARSPSKRSLQAQLMLVIGRPVSSKSRGSQKGVWSRENA